MTNWYLEDSLIDHFRGGSKTELDASNPISFINTSIPALVTNWRKEAIEKAVERGEGAKDEFGNIKRSNDFVYGITDDEVAAGAEKVRGVKLTKDYGKTADLYEYNLKNKDGSFKSTEEVKKFIREREKVKDAAASSGYSGEALGIDLNTVSLEGFGNAVRKAEEKRKAELLKPSQDLAKGQLELSKTQAEKADAFRTSQLNFQKSQAEEANAFRRHQLEVEGIRAENARRERQFEAAQNRELTREQNKMQLNIAMMDRQDKREDRRIAREDREADQRQASIMMLIKGLTQLGAGFTV